MGGLDVVTLAEKISKTGMQRQFLQALTATKTKQNGGNKIGK